MPTLSQTLAQPYNREVFIQHVLRRVFGAGERLQVFTTAQVVPMPAKADQKLAASAVQYATVTLDDGAEVRCLEVRLQPQVQPEQSRVGIQALVRRLLTVGQAALVNFVPAENEVKNRPWRFSLVAKDAGLSEEGRVVEQTSHARRYTYLLGPGQACRTPDERLSLLAGSASIMLETLVKAFEVEVLSKEFFKEYKRHYEAFCDHLVGSKFRQSVFNGDDKAIRDFVKKLLGRLVFLYFVQKKGWLGATSIAYADGDQAFVFNLFEASGGNENFYPVWLSRLFFETLNQDETQNPRRAGDAFVLPDGQTVCIPFLNGGLFDRDRYDHAKYQLPLPPTLFHHPHHDDEPRQRGFLDFLGAYNFTVQEDSPDEHVVAVDPEMLGNIFENLLEDNKDKGAFYTPKEIVHYMCRESLIEYLDTRLPAPASAERRPALEALVRDKQAGPYVRVHTAALRKLLAEVKICDPAIGSGAFPMGLLHEIYLCQLALHDPTQPLPVGFHAATKLAIIQNSIYGVDIERGAVDIARLRFWLSLVVDEDRPRPLPNLDYKIVEGNSLVSKLAGETLTLDWELGDTSTERKVKAITLKLGAKQKAFFTESGDKTHAQLEIRNLKLELLLAQIFLDERKVLARMPAGTIFGQSAKDQKQTTALEERLRGLKAAAHKLQQLQKNPAAPLPYFDWRLDFPEVLNPHVTTKPGFDIVIGNPPYGLKDKGKDYLAFVTQNYSPARKVADSYFLFIVLGTGLAKASSVISYIVPNTFCDLEQGDEFRRWFLGENRLSHLFDTQWAFEKAIVDTVVFIAQTKMPTLGNSEVNFTANDKTQSFLSINSILSSSGHKLVYRFSNKLNSDLVGRILKESYNVKSIANVRAGVILYEMGKGNPPQTEKTMSEKPFTVKHKRPHGWRPLVRGVDINRYSLGKSNEFVKYGNWLAAPRDPEIFKGPVIMIRRTDDRIKATYVTNDEICVKSCHVLKPHDKRNNMLVLALLNSKLLQWIFEVQNPQMVGKVFAEIKLVYVENLPIRKASDNQLSTFNSLVTQILAAKAASATADTTALEQEIDRLIYRLYFTHSKQHYTPLLTERKPVLSIKLRRRSTCRVDKSNGR